MFRTVSDDVQRNRPKRVEFYYKEVLTYKVSVINNLKHN